MSKKLSLLLVAGLLSGCATPEVVHVCQSNDDQLSCQQLRQELNKCADLRTEVESEKGLTGTNTAAALFFWPALLATYSNIGDALKAVEKREKHLWQLYEKKCSDSKEKVCRT